MRTKHWLLLLGSILLLSMILLLAQRLFPTAEGSVAEIYQDGVLIRSIDLSTITDTTLIPIQQDERENILCIEPGRIAMQSANCPDGLCVRRGFISDGSTPIVCLPNRIVVKITHAAPSAADAVTQ